jgi:malonyl-CoA O-methyltransferase
MTSPRNTRVAQAFAARAKYYNNSASLQVGIAEKLAQHIPQHDHPKILEVGCGTGFLTRQLMMRYPHGDFLITDIAPEMVAKCQGQTMDEERLVCRFAIMDGEAPDCGAGFDLIALSMTLQWFADPLAGLERLKALLKPGGHLLFATTGPENFPEWRAALDACGEPHGFISMPQLPGVVEQDKLIVDYGSGIGFLKALKDIGAATSRPGYDPLSPGKLRAALRRLEQDHEAQITWQIVYGLITA